MNPFKNKNDYSVTVYYKREKVLFTEFVHSIYSYASWLRNKNIKFDYILVYVRRTRQPLCYYSENDYIHSKPNYQSRGRIKPGW